MDDLIDILNIERHLPELAGVQIEKVVDDLLSGAYSLEKIDAVVRYVVARWHRFAPADISKLKSRIPGFYLKASYAHWLALRGYKFSLEELIALKETWDGRGQTVAHYMARSGHVFSPSEWAQIGHWKGLFKRYTVAENAQEAYRTAMSNIAVRCSERFAIVFHDGKPVFVQNSLESNSFNRGKGQYTGNVITCVWGEFHGGLGVVGKMYDIRIEGNTVRLGDVGSRDEYSTVPIMALNHLVERLNRAIQARQDYDFTDLYQALQILFIEFEFEMFVVTG